MLLWYPIILSLVIGLAMLGVWAMLLARGEVAGLSDGSRAIRFHLAAEGLTAVLLIGAAVALMVGVSWAGPVAAVGLGAALYATINSPGYYADRGERAFVVMFLMLAVLVAGAIAVLVLA
jgi:hypothetical protein